MTDFALTDIAGSIENDEINGKKDDKVESEKDGVKSRTDGSTSKEDEKYEKNTGNEFVSLVDKDGVKSTTEGVTSKKDEKHEENNEFVSLVHQIGN